MNTIVIQLSTSQIMRLAQDYQSFKVPNHDPNKQHFFKVDGTAVSVYQSGKVMFQGPQAEHVASQWSSLPSQAAEKQKKSSSFVNNQLSTMGSDEVGNGSYFGGLAVVASLVQPQQHAFLKELGVNDSKMLTDQKILQIAPILQEKIAHQLLLLSPKKYNEVVPARYNAVSVKVALHNQALYLLLQKVASPEQIIIDAFTSAQNYQKYLRNEVNRFEQPVQLIEKAEGQCLAVAVSSIIARAAFLEQLKQLGQDVGYDLPSGAGQASDQVAAQLLQAYGISALEKTAKLHFKNTEKAKQISRSLKS